MQATASEDYIAAFVARCDAIGTAEPGSPGLHGARSTAAPLRVRLLITDDRAYARLSALLPDVRGGTINVFAAAGRCINLLEGHPGWTLNPAAAMIRRDLRAVPESVLPGALTHRPVRRLVTDEPDGVSLEAAVAVAIRAARSGQEPTAALADYLRSLPDAFRLSAAVDAQGAVRATSGWGVFGARATVIFVNTDPAWRRRGVGGAMTTAALRAARDAGASQVCLDASDAAVSMYRRLAFETVTDLARFTGPG